MKVYIRFHCKSEVNFEFGHIQWTSCKSIGLLAKKSAKKICSRWGLNPGIKNESLHAQPLDYASQNNSAIKLNNIENV